MTIEPDTVSTQTEQEQFWAGDFGNEYTSRNTINPQDRQPFFAQVLSKMDGISSICELGANRGHNLKAIQAINPQYRLTGVELNATAYSELSRLEGIQAVHSSIEAFQQGLFAAPIDNADAHHPDDEYDKTVQFDRVNTDSLAPIQTFDCVFTCGVLIHLNPEWLPHVYRKLFALSGRYILINEYYNPTPTELAYRGHSEKLFKRDFGGEFMDTHPHQLRVIDYGFLWQRMNPTWDNTTWWLFEKVNEARES